jgi:hypothetical protein
MPPDNPEVVGPVSDDLEPFEDSQLVDRVEDR